MATTLVGIFDDFAAAQKAVQALTQAGVKQTDISLARNEPAGKGYTTYGGAKSTDLTTGNSIGNKIAGFFDSVFGSDINEDERGVYAESVRRGSTIVTVQADDANAERAVEILNNSGAIDVNRRAEQYRAAGYKKYDAKAPLYTSEQTNKEFQNFAGQGEVALPVIEEQLNIGKQVVQRGGVRIHTRVSERPVEETVNLREEKVTVNRRPVDRAVTDADVAASQQQDFTITERSEQAVVGKTARVVEEVVVGKDITERQETVRDTVRRSDVEVEETNPDAAGKRKSAKQ